MFKKIQIALTLLISLSIVSGFSKHDPIVVKEVEINIMKSSGILRYDFVLKKTKELILDNNKAGGSPGPHENELNYAVRPNPALASSMELEQNVKMKFRGGSISGRNFKGEEETIISLEYAIKKDSDFEGVRTSALDSTLLVLRGNEVIVEIPLNKKE